MVGEQRVDSIHYSLLTIRLKWIMDTFGIGLSIVLVSVGALGYYAFVFLPAQFHRWRCQSLRAFAKAIELRTQGRYGDTDLLVRLALTVSARLGIEGEERKRLELAAYLRDIGMVAIPYALLNKPTPLSPMEQLTLARHVEIGAAIVEQIPGLSAVAPLVRLHHVEYAVQPDAPLSAHLLAALSDLMEIAHHAGYGAALSALQTGAGTRYHPQVVQAIEAALQAHPLENWAPLRRSAALWVGLVLYPLKDLTRLLVELTRY
ncbi:Cyclic di-GMP phosphodiesterase response regulator RpfG [bacterium HR15]|nr:Cyclic di-GMP phosphodiesterase response regulator RpfG [bacterium HR15]